MHRCIRLIINCKPTNIYEKRNHQPDYILVLEIAAIILFHSLRAVLNLRRNLHAVQHKIPLL